VIDIPSLKVNAREIAALVGPMDGGKDVLFQLPTGCMQPTTTSLP
jgi:ABC-type branched-subunit amino acid transport system ATPase component